MQSIDEAIPRRVHLVGIGGAGMAALAKCLCQLGRAVSGSDLRLSETTTRLKAIGATIYKGHQPSNVLEAELVIASDAIDASNPEIIEARLRGIRIIRRASCLDILARGKVGVMVAGSHGKSTTSAMITWVLDQAGSRPSYALGACLPDLGMNQAAINDGDAFIVEACEAFRNLFNFHPSIAVITNIDGEHLDHYGSADALENAFLEFANRAQQAVIINGDDRGTQQILPRVKKPLVTFGFSSSNTLSVSNFEMRLDGSRFNLLINQEVIETIELLIPGHHAAMNALACLATVYALGMDLSIAIKHLAGFRGVNRRWQRHAVDGGMVLISDFAHHPTELAALADTAESVRAKGQRLVIIFQPQLYSRTKLLLREFAQQLARFDQVYLLDIDAGGEKDITGISSSNLAFEILSLSGKVDQFTDTNDFASRSIHLLTHGDFVVVAGAGTVGNLAQEIAARFATSVHSDNQKVRQLCTALKVASPSLERPAVSIPTDPCVIDLFDQQVKCWPCNVAFSDAFRELTYSEIDQAATRVSHILRQNFDIWPGHAVGVMDRPSLEAIVTLLALAKLGAVYLPISFDTPSDRVRFMLKQTNAKLLIGRKFRVADVEFLSIDAVEEMIWTKVDIKTAITPTRFADDTAYVCFTSGSTGSPKGVPIHNAALMNFILGATSRFGLNQNTRMLLNTSIGFDVSLAEIWMTLCSGGKLCAPDKAKPLTGALLGNFIERFSVSHMAITPSILATVPHLHLSSLTCIISAGEACPNHLVDFWAKGRLFFNAYGPTEATIYSTVAECRPEQPVTIGLPLPNTYAHILDKDLNPVSGNEIGELYLSGDALASGYINLPEETSARFLYKNGLRLYRTGDLAKRSPTSEIEYVGRQDNQIKILGNRIELEEIENTLTGLPQILDAAVTVHETANIKRLVCFIVPKNCNTFDLEQLRDALSAWLPVAMIPADFVILDEIPLTPNGKKNRAGLISRHKNAFITRTDFTEPRTVTEVKMSALWQRILGIEFAIGIHESFTGIGGDSLKALELMFEIEQTFRIVIPPNELTSITTIAKISSYIDQLIALKNTQNIETIENTGQSRIYKGLKSLTVNWVGKRVNDASLIVSIGPTSAPYDFFLCLQSEDELRSFANTLGDNFRVHGIRSGHLITNYNHQDTVDICNLYIKEIEAIEPRGRLVVGGICQGGLIAKQIMDSLIQQGTSVELLVLIEQTQLLPSKSPVAFFYSEDSKINPFIRFNEGLSRYDEIYGSGYTLDVIPGTHGTIHIEPQIHILCNRLKDLLGLTQSNGTDLAIENLDGQSASDIELVSRSSLFDEAFYRKQILEVYENSAQLAHHYITRGWRLGYDPSPFFSTSGYLGRSPDVSAARINPLVHFLRYGMQEGRIAWSEEDVTKWQAPWINNPDSALNLINMLKKPWLKLNKNSRVVVHTHSNGNIVFKNFQRLIIDGFNAIGISCTGDDETFSTRMNFGLFEPTIRIVLAPHEFFYLNGAPSNKKIDFNRILLINSEQIPSIWFSKSLPFLLKANYVLDLNPQTAACLNQLGVNAKFLPLGTVTNSEALTAWDGNCDSVRDIDILMIGTNSPRRENFITRNKHVFANRSCKISLVNVNGVLHECTADAVSIEDYIKLARRSKILLNIHHFSTPYFEWQRLVHFGLLQGCCIVTETVTQIPDVMPNIHYLQEKIENIPMLLNWLLDDEDGKLKVKNVSMTGYNIANSRYKLNEALGALFYSDASTQPSY